MIKSTRREFLKTSALAATTLLPASISRNVLALKQSWATQPFGRGEVIAVSDGHLSLPANFAFPQHASEDELHTLLRSHNLPTDRSTPDCNITVWRAENRLVLFDTGAGSNFMPSAGKLLENMEAAGIDPVDVTDVVFTHAHPDHIWGVIDDFDELICPEATYHMGAVEWNYWSAKDTIDKTPENRKSFVVGAQNRFSYLEERISLFKAGEELIPGLEAVDSSGHTPGHMSFAIHDKGQSLFILGDAITNVALSFARPHWPSASDQDPVKGIETRKRLLERLEHEKSLLIGYHLPHPGLGRVERDKQSFKFVVE